MAKDDPVATAGGAHDIPYVALCKVRPLPPYARRPWLSLPYGRAYPAACRPHPPKQNTTVNGYTHCHLCGWIERIPGGTRHNDGLETGLWSLRPRD